MPSLTERWPVRRLLPANGAGWAACHPEEPPWPPSPRSSHPPTTRSTTGRAPRPGTRPPFADEWVAKIEAFRQTLTRARPDVLVMVGSDHFHQIWLDNMPQFLIGKAPFYDANFYIEEREFGLPRMFGG